MHVSYAAGLRAASSSQTSRHAHGYRIDSAEHSKDLAGETEKAQTATIGTTRNRQSWSGLGDRLEADHD